MFMTCSCLPRCSDSTRPMSFSRLIGLMFMRCEDDSNLNRRLIHMYEMNEA
jgi:hypothetical protein